jgi:hypothetical protein
MNLPARPLLLVALVAATLAAPAFAQPPATAVQEDIVVLGTRAAQLEVLARASGLSIDDVRMVLGLRRPGYTEYVYTYEWSHRRLRAALGRTRYDALFARGEATLDQRLAGVAGALATR